MLNTKLQSYIKQLDTKHLKRTPSLLDSNHLNFSSNDYLNLANHEQLKLSYQAGFEKYPAGSTGSMLVSGYHETHEALEIAFSDALKVDSALLFPSGYAANLSIMQLLAALDIHALIDKEVHASIYDGLKLAGGSYTRYKLQPKKSISQNTLLLTESIFSMSGRTPDFLALAKQYPLIIDEAHAFGVLGPKGLGRVAAHKLTSTEVPLRVIPLGKALGASGAIVAGDKDWITALLQTARPLIYSTAMSPALAYGLLHAFKILQHADTARHTLQQNILCFKQHIKHSPLNFQDSDTPIQQLKLGCPKKALMCALQLQAKNINCISMREPTVRRAETGLRIVLNSSHTTDNIQYLFESLHQCLT
ncbi:MAG: aminotransferase class I/II-fold pyridoxal phosphate-dependent enzyme [Legionella sp.]|nr:aminotransferase class I/II-fold pyridoxal phosphate-dependent enzyme [Legionella sp.]